jgi:hypothetical protein
MLEGEADDAGEPLVELVLVLRLLGPHHPGGAFAGHQLGAAALGEVACALSLTLPRLRGRVRERAILELPDLVRRPVGTSADQSAPPDKNHHENA